MSSSSPTTRLSTVHDSVPYRLSPADIIYLDIPYLLITDWLFTWECNNYEGRDIFKKSMISFLHSQCLDQCWESVECAKIRVFDEWTSHKRKYMFILLWFMTFYIFSYLSKCISILPPLDYQFQERNHVNFYCSNCMYGSKFITEFTYICVLM